ncbi:MAG: hypothetical protein ACTSUV_07250, partial [Candidatus Ranarchaeia archaeon]
MQEVGNVEEIPIKVIDMHTHFMSSTWIKQMKIGIEQNKKMMKELALELPLPKGCGFFLHRPQPLQVLHDLQKRNFPRPPRYMT